MLKCIPSRQPNIDRALPSNVDLPVLFSVLGTMLRTKIFLKSTDWPEEDFATPNLLYFIQYYIDKENLRPRLNNYISKNTSQFWIWP